VEYRRFGRTGLQMPVFSCGGMRYQHKWQELTWDEIPPEGQANLEATIHRALELGINHIETARGYGSSEMQLGRVLPTLPRERIIVQTKVGPNPDGQEFLQRFERSMECLQLDHVDLLSFHGINDQEGLDFVLQQGGCLEVARQLQREGRVRFVGFSTHGACSIIVKAIETGEFDYVNVHWYFVNDLNWPAILAAERQDMGVFIISPTDKGGMLQKPSAKMEALCNPLMPMQFNDLYCLVRPQVHTLSIGAARPSDFDAHVAMLEHYSDAASTIAPIEQRIRAEMADCLGAAWVQRWSEGLPEYTDVPGEVNLQEILRLWTYGKPLDLMEWARSRYNLMGNNNNWAPGNKAAELDAEAFAPYLKDSPFADRIPDILRQAHALFGGEQELRLSQK